MKIIQVCIGSACHLKGSYEVIQRFKALIEAQDMEHAVELRSSFCLGECSQAVSVKLNDGPVCSVTPETVDQFFSDQILGGEKP